MADRTLLDPFPIGWYWVDFSKNLGKNQLRGKKWMGSEVVYWRDRDGRVCMAKATCPHLGAKLSPNMGGKLHDGCLVCPYHGYTYDTTGSCVRTRHGPPNEHVQLSTYSTVETGGVLIAFWHPEGQKPEWTPPSMDGPEWSEFTFYKDVIAAHPQEACENGVDLAHLPHVHGYREVTQIGEPQIEGPMLQTRFKLVRRVGLSRFIGLNLNVDAIVTLWGLGMSTIEPSMDYAGVYIRQLAMMSPIDEERTSFVMGLQLKKIGKPNALVPGLGLLPASLLRLWMRSLFFKIYRHDISQDYVIWENKDFLKYPRLDSADSSIMRFRRFSQQFYPNPQF